MSLIRINRTRSRPKPVRSHSVKPVSLPTFSFYDYLPVSYVDGELVLGRRAVQRGPRR